MATMTAYSQNFTVNGSAKNIPNTDCYKLTDAINGQNGSVWFSEKLDLTNSFDLEFFLNFGTQDVNGADGIVFVLQTVGKNALGSSGGALGFEGFSPALGIEFDDYENGSIYDPTYDHIAIVKNGSVSHPSSASIYSPVSALTNRGNIEDGKDHLVRIIWNPVGFQLEVRFDCVSRIKVTNFDLVNTIFNGKSQVWWGFTSSTGGLNNNQTVCIQKDVFRKDVFQICENTSMMLTTGKSLDNKYTWSPGTFLSATDIKTPVCKPTTDMRYIVSYKDQCSKNIFDTIDVIIVIPPIVTLPNDSFTCGTTLLSIRPKVINTFTAWAWSNGFSAFTQQVLSKKMLWFEASNLCGADRDTINIEHFEKPLVNLGADTSICIDDTLNIKPILVGDLLTFNWMDNSKQIPRKIYNQGVYWANIKNICGTASDTLKISILKTLSMNLGNDTIVCPGEMVEIRPAIKGNYNTLEWNDAYNGINRSVLSTQKLWLNVSNDCNSAVDTIQIEFKKILPLTLGNDTSICNKDSLLLNIESDIYELPEWSDGYFGYQRWILKEGIFSVKTKYLGCKTSDDINILIDYSPYFSPINDTLGCINIPLEYTIDQRNKKVTWDGEDHAFTKKYLNNAGKHWVNVEAKCGQRIDTFNIALKVCNCDFWIPTAFTPQNQDLLNDELKIQYDCRYSEFQFTIYNRWGEKLWHTDNPDKYWDGTYQGLPVPMGVYVWIAYYTGPSNGIPVQKIEKGMVYVIR